MLRQCALTAAFATALAAVPTSVDGGEPALDKSHFNLFNPTPRELMRELSTDRPDKTESPYTVDAGRVQVELDLVTYTSDRGARLRPDRPDWHLYRAVQREERRKRQ